MANKSMLLGQSAEYKIASMLLADGREIYLPVVDDHGVDMLVCVCPMCVSVNLVDFLYQNSLKL